MTPWAPIEPMTMSLQRVEMDTAVSIVPGGDASRRTAHASPGRPARTGVTGRSRSESPDGGRESLQDVRDSINRARLALLEAHIECLPLETTRLISPKSVANDDTAAARPKEPPVAVVEGINAAVEREYRVSASSVAREAWRSWFVWCVTCVGAFWPVLDATDSGAGATWTWIIAGAVWLVGVVLLLHFAWCLSDGRAAQWCHPLVGLRSESYWAWNKAYRRRAHTDTTIDWTATFTQSATNMTGPDGVRRFPLNPFSPRSPMGDRSFWSSCSNIDTSQVLDNVDSDDGVSDDDVSGSPQRPLSIAPSRLLLPAGESSLNLGHVSTLWARQNSSRWRSQQRVREPVVVLWVVVAPITSSFLLQEEVVARYPSIPQRQVRSLNRLTPTFALMARNYRTCVCCVLLSESGVIREGDEEAVATAPQRLTKQRVVSNVCCLARIQYPKPSTTVTVVVDLESDTSLLLGEERTVASTAGAYSVYNEENVGASAAMIGDAIKSVHPEAGADVESETDACGSGNGGSGSRGSHGSGTGDNTR